MGKLLLLLAGLFLVVALLRGLTRLRRKPDSEPTPPQQTHEKKLQALLPCPECGVHMAASELADHVATHRH